MDFQICPITAEDQAAVLEMMEVFYSSDAVSTNGSREIFETDIATCIGGSPYLEGYVFRKEQIMGYAMLAKSFSTEFGKPCIWIEDIFIKPEYRNNGIGNAFFAFVEERYPHALLRLEVEPENEPAMALYTKRGFDILPYTEMKK